MEKYFSKYSQHHYRFYQHGSSQLVYDAKEAVYRQKPAELPEKVNALRKRFLSGQKAIALKKRSSISEVIHRIPIHNQIPNLSFKDKLTVNLSKRLRLLPRMVRSHWEETESNIKLHNVHSVYPINIVLVTKTDSGCSYYRYKLTTSRKGIHRLEQVE